MSKVDSHGYVRESAINPKAVQMFRDELEDQSINDIDLFYYVYGVLHVPYYRTKYANNLKKELPRIPFPIDKEDFFVIAGAGYFLGEMHTNYEEVDMHQIIFAKGGWTPKDGVSEKEWFAVKSSPMKHPFIEDEKGKKTKKRDLSIIEYNDYITVQDVPLQVYDYVVNGKAAVKWVMQEQRIKKDKKTGIVSDANAFANETMKDPSYPLKLLARVIKISLLTVDIIEHALSDISFDDGKIGLTTAEINKEITSK